MKLGMENMLLIGVRRGSDNLKKRMYDLIDEC